MKRLLGSLTWKQILYLVVAAGVIAALAFPAGTGCGGPSKPAWKS